MSKRMKLSSQFQLRKHVDDDNGSFVDHISQLPDEILVTILSHLTLREAAQSSIISQRWKKLWTFSNLNLDFDAPSVMFQLDTTASSYKQKMRIKHEGNKFAKWVNQILVSLKSEVAGGFKICFGLDNTHKWNLDKWIKFAIQQKKVNRLELLLQQDYYGEEKVLYSLPEEVLTYSLISLLRVFRLSNVEVSGTLLEGILTKCPSLEEISISWSATLLGVKFRGINLKLIEIRQCSYLHYVEVDAPNLVSFLYSGTPARIRIAHTPKLNAMELGACYSDAHFPMYPEVSSFFSQIETIALDYGELFICEVPPVFPEYKILKCLRLKLGTHDGKSLLSCIFMLKKCPMLHTFVVEFYWSSKHIERKMEKIEGEELQFLKVAEFKWFSGYSADQELVISIIQNSPNLEKLIFDPWNPICKVEQDLRGVPNVVRYDINTRRVEARKRAKQLADKYCHTNIQVVIV